MGSLFLAPKITTGMVAVLHTITRKNPWGEVPPPKRGGNHHTNGRVPALGRGGSFQIGHFK